MLLEELSWWDWLKTFGLANFSSAHWAQVLLQPHRHPASATPKQLLPFSVFQAWEESGGIVSFPNVQFLASEVSKLLTKEIKKKLNGKPAGNSQRAHGLGCAQSCVFCDPNLTISCNVLCYAFKEGPGNNNRKY